MKPLPTLALIAAVSSLCPTTTSLLRAAEHDSQAHGEAWAAVKQAVAVLHATAGNKCHGTVRFTQEGDAVKVVADIEGLTPGQKHAFHIHQFGDCTSSDGMSAGGHYNPEGHQHGLPEKEMRHAGDLGNLTADNDGKAHYEITVNNMSGAGMKNPIIGRGVSLHAQVDDGSDPVGDPGARMAGGVIAVARPAGQKQ